MLNSAKRQDLETEAIMTPRFLAVLDGTRDKESILMLMLWWMACLAEKTINSVLPGSAEGGDFSSMWIYQQDSLRSAPRSLGSSGGKDSNS